VIKGEGEQVTSRAMLYPLGLRKQPLCQHAHSNWTHPALAPWRNFGRRPFISHTYARKQIRRPWGAVPNLRARNFAFRECVSGFSHADTENERYPNSREN